MRWLDVVGSLPSFEGLFGNFFWLGQIGQVCGQKSHLGPTGGSRATQIDIHLVEVVRLVTQVDFGQVGGLGSQKSSPYLESSRQPRLYSQK